MLFRRCRRNVLFSSSGNQIVASHSRWKPLSSFFRDRRREDFTLSEPGWLARFNDHLAVRMTIIFGSIWCVYAFFVFSLIPVVRPDWQEPLLYISNCVQLVALPALMVGNAILTRGSDQRATEDHAALMEILNDVREEVSRLRTMTTGLAQTAEESAKRPSDVVSISDEAFISVNEGDDKAAGTEVPKGGQVTSGG